MKIVIASVRDTGGTAWNLAHAINKVTPEHYAIDMSGQRSYINYPQTADMTKYGKTTIRKILCGVYPAIHWSQFLHAEKLWRAKTVTSGWRGTHRKKCWGNFIHMAKGRILSSRGFEGYADVRLQLWRCPTCGAKNSYRRKTCWCCSAKK